MSGWMDKDVKRLRSYEEWKKDARRADLRALLIAMASVFVVLIFCAAMVVAVMGVDR